MVEFSPSDAVQKINLTNVTYKSGVNLSSAKDVNPFKDKSDALSVAYQKTEIGQNVVKLNPYQNTSTNQPYVNPYDNADPNKPVDQDPFTWKDFPTNLSNPKDIKDTYKEALKNNDGYKLLQLAKLEFDNVYTYGNLVPSKMLLEAYNIAVHNKDPFLAFYVTQFDSKYNLFTSVSAENMMKKVCDLSLERKDPRVLNKLANLEELFDFMKDMTPKDIQKKTLFLNNENFAPYPNPYDNPNPDKPLDSTPFLWKDFPSSIDTEYEMNKACRDALKSNDGYKLLQLAKVELNHNYSKEISPETLLKHSYNIASYNKDPYLLLYVSVFQKEANLLKNVEPSDIFRKAYDTSIERRDAKSLYVLYDYEKVHDFLPDVTPKKMFQKGIEIERLYKEPLV